MRTSATIKSKTVDYSIMNYDGETSQLSVAISSPQE